MYNILGGSPEPIESHCEAPDGIFAMNSETYAVNHAFGVPTVQPDAKEFADIDRRVKVIG